MRTLAGASTVPAAMSTARRPTVHAREVLLVGEPDAEGGRRAAGRRRWRAPPPPRAPCSRLRPGSRAPAPSRRRRAARSALACAGGASSGVRPRFSQCVRPRRHRTPTCSRSAESTPCSSSPGAAHHRHAALVVEVLLPKNASAHGRGCGPGRAGRRAPRRNPRARPETGTVSPRSAIANEAHSSPNPSAASTSGTRAMPAGLVTAARASSATATKAPASPDGRQPTSLRPRRPSAEGDVGGLRPQRHRDARRQRGGEEGVGAEPRLRCRSLASARNAGSGLGFDHHRRHVLLAHQLVEAREVGRQHLRQRGRAARRSSPPGRRRPPGDCVGGRGVRAVHARVPARPACC